MTTTVHPETHGDSPVVATHGWRDMFFLHWAWPASRLVPLLPPGLVLDRHEGEAYLTVVPMRMEAMRPRGFPAFLGLSFLEVMVRTYVRGPAGRGVFFLSIEANSNLASLVARTALGLPYEHARISADVHGRELAYSALRPDPEHHALSLRAIKSLEAPRPPATPLERFLLDRQSSFVVRNGVVKEVVLQHGPLQIRPGTAIVEDTSLLLADHLGPMPATKPIVHIAEPLDAEICFPHTVAALDDRRAIASRDVERLLPAM